MLRKLIAKLRLPALLFLLPVCILCVAADAFAKGGFQIGRSDTRRDGLKEAKYRELLPAEIGEYEDGLMKICPCLIIFLERDEPRNVHVLDPRDEFKLPKGHKNPKRDFRSKVRKRKKKDLCDCYKRHKFGCNLILTLANSEKPITLWRSEFIEGKNSGGSWSNNGDVSWNTQNTQPSTARVKGEEQTPTETPAHIWLAHELAHPYLWIKSGYKDQKFSEKTELAASHAENQIRAEQQKLTRKKKQYSPRFRYKDRDLDVEIPAKTETVISEEDLLDCDKKGAYLIPGEDWGPGDEGPGYAVQIPEECVSTTYYSSDTTTTDDEEIALTPPVEIAVTPPEDGGPGLHVDNGGGVPMCPKAPPPTVTVTQHPPTETTPPPEKEDPPDLGLAKAAQIVVQLVLTGLETGKHIEGAAVKSLDAPPPLQLAGDVDPALTSSDAYASGVEAGFTGKDGDVTIGQDDTATQTDEQAKSQLASMSLVEVKVEEEKKGRLVIAMEADDGAEEGKRPHLPASVAGPEVDICVAHSFRIGRHPTFIASVPETQIEPVKRSAAQTEGVFFVEPDPCRTIYMKRRLDTPDYADRVQ